MSGEETDISVKSINDFVVCKLWMLLKELMVNETNAACTQLSDTFFSINCFLVKKDFWTVICIYSNVTVDSLHFFAEYMIGEQLHIFSDLGHQFVKVVSVDNSTVFPSI